MRVSYFDSFPPTVRASVRRSILLLPISILLCILSMAGESGAIHWSILQAALTWPYAFILSLILMMYFSTSIYWQCNNVECQRCGMPNIWIQGTNNHHFCGDCGVEDPFAFGTGLLSHNKRVNDKTVGDLISAQHVSWTPPKDMASHAIISGYTKNRKALFARRCYNMTSIPATLGCCLLTDTFRCLRSGQSYAELTPGVLLGLGLNGISAAAFYARKPRTTTCNGCNEDGYFPFCTVCGQDKKIASSMENTNAGDVSPQTAAG